MREADPQPGLCPGDRVGGYRIVRLLGAGGMGEVYLGQHRHLERQAAIKVLLPQVSSHPEVLRRFFAEARTTSKLAHPNIVEILDCDVLEDGRAFIVMEFLEGESLAGYLEKNRVVADVSTAAALIAITADALAAAHGRGIVHRDLKPDNIFLYQTPDRSVDLKVLDFGIAKLMGEGDGSNNRTRTGMLLGTPLFMSPEQCRGASTIDHRSDIYSLGCVAFGILAGRPPFDSELPGDLLIAHVTQTPPRLSQTRSDVPDALDQLVFRMMAKEPADRPQHLGQVIAEIEAITGKSVATLRQSVAALSIRQADAVDNKGEVSQAATQPRPATAVALPSSFQPASPTTTLGASSVSFQAPAKRAGIPKTAAFALAAVALVAVVALLWPRDKAPVVALPPAAPAAVVSPAAAPLAPALPPAVAEQPTAAPTPNNGATPSRKRASRSKPSRTKTGVKPNDEPAYGAVGD